MTLNRRFALALGITALFGAAVAVNAAQIGNTEVPFAFEIAGQKMGPGSYTAASSAGGDVLIRNTTTGQSMYILPRPEGGTLSDESKLKFTCYGAQCFLSQVQFGQSRITYNVPSSHHEKELSASVARPEVKLIALR